MKWIKTAATVLALGWLAGAVTFAHPFTVKGTVVSADPAHVTVRVINERTKKPEVNVYALNKDTAILRGDVVVTFAAARIQKGEPVAVTVNVDDRDDWAEVIRLNAKK